MKQNKDLFHFILFFIVEWCTMYNLYISKFLINLYIYKNKLSKFKKNAKKLKKKFRFKFFDV